MIDGISSYSVADFISFTDEVYFRLFERQFEAWWPAHALLAALGVATLAFAVFGRVRIVAVLLAVPLLTSAVTFHFQLYAELTPVGRIFGWGFLVQIPLVLAWGYLSRHRQEPGRAVSRLVGGMVAVCGLLGYPLLSMGREGGFAAAEYPGMAPDPTLCLLLGVLLMCARPGWFLILLPIPVIWAATNAATLHALGAPRPMMLPVLTAITMITALWMLRFPRKTHEAPAE